MQADFLPIRERSIGQRGATDSHGPAGHSPNNDPLSAKRAIRTDFDLTRLYD